MRDDAKILRYKNEIEVARQRFMKTGSKTYLEKMFALKRKIEREMNKEARLLGWTLLGMSIVTLAGPLIIWSLK